MGETAHERVVRLDSRGVACVTRCVGGLNVVDPVACAYVERSPVVLISGSPGLGECERDAMLHHRVVPFSTQLDILSKITVAAECLDDPSRPQGVPGRQ